MRCPSISDLLRFLEEKFFDQERETIAAHVDECAACQGTLAKWLDEDDASSLLALRCAASAQPPPEQPTELRYLEQLAVKPPNWDEAVQASEPGRRDAPAGATAAGRAATGSVFNFSL